METSAEFIARLKDLLSKNRTAVVLDLLPTIFRQDEERFNAATMLRGRYSQTRENQLENLITEEVASVEYTRINHAIVPLLDEAENAVFDVAAVQKMLDELVETDATWRVKEGILDRVRQSQAENIARMQKDDTVVSTRVSSKVAVWIVLPIFLIFAIGFLVLALRSPAVKTVSPTKTPTHQTAPAKSDPPPAQVPKKEVPPPLRKQ